MLALDAKDSDGDTGAPACFLDEGGLPGLGGVLAGGMTLPPVELSGFFRKRMGVEGSVVRPSWLPEKLESLSPLRE